MNIKFTFIIQNTDGPEQCQFPTMQVLQNSLGNMDQKKTNLNPARLNRLQFSTHYAKSKENSKKLGRSLRAVQKITPR